MWITYNLLTGAQTGGPFETLPLPGLGDSVRLMPQSAIAGLSIWDAAVKGFIDVPPPARQSRPIKTSDTPRASTTSFANDPDLIATVVTGGLYRLDLMLYFHIQDAAADAKWQLTGPLGAVLRASLSSAAPSVAALGLGAAQTVLVSAAGHHLVRASGLLTIGAVTGPLAVQWAQNTSSATATILKAGSHFDLTKL